MNKLILKNGNVYYEKRFQKLNLLINENKIIKITSKEIFENNCEVIDCDKKHIVPGFIDLHVHSRIHNNIELETVNSIINSAIQGGYQKIVLMANTNPIIDSVEKITKINNLFKQSPVQIIQSSAITKNFSKTELVNFQKNSSSTKFFSNDGKPIFLKETMIKIVNIAKKYNCYLLLHEEDVSVDKNKTHHYLKNNQGFNYHYESNLIKRDIEINQNTKAKLHFQHVSTIESINLIKKAKLNKQPITCEVTPHHLILNNDEIKYIDGKYKMNPPLTLKHWQDCLIKEVNNDIIDIIVSDHAPHLSQDKTVPYQLAKNGIIGMNTSFSSLYTYLVLTNKIKLEKIIEKLSIKVAELFFNEDISIKKNNNANLLIIDLKKSFVVTEKFLKSQCKNNPFINKELYGFVEYNILSGRVFKNKIT